MRPNTKKSWDRMRICTLILEYITPKLKLCGIDKKTLDHNDDLFVIGALDSFEMVELITKLEQETGLEADLLSLTSPDSESSAPVPSINKLADIFLIK